MSIFMDLVRDFESFDLSFQEVRSLTQSQVGVLIRRQFKQNKYLQLVLTKTLESFDFKYQITLPDPFRFLQRQREKSLTQVLM